MNEYDYCTKQCHLGTGHISTHWYIFFHLIHGNDLLWPVVQKWFDVYPSKTREQGIHSTKEEKKGWHLLPYGIKYHNRAEPPEVMAVKDTYTPAPSSFPFRSLFLYQNI